MFFKRLSFLISFLLITLFFVPVHGQDTTLVRILAAKDDTIKATELLMHAIGLVDVDPQKAKQEFQMVVTLSQKLNFHYGAGNAWMNLGNINTESGNYKEAFTCYRTAIDHFTAIDKLNGVAMCYGNIGLVHDFLGNADSTIYYYLKSASNLEEVKNYRDLGRVYNNIGIVYGNMKSHEKSIYYKTKAFNLGREQKDTFVTIRALSELAASYGDMKQYNKAMTLAYEALDLANKTRNLMHFSRAYEAVSISLLDRKKADSAVYAAKQVIRICSQLDDIHGYLQGALNLSEAYDLQGAHLQRLAVLQDALEKCMHVDNISLRSDLYLDLAEASYNLGKYKEAFDYHTNYVIYKDSVFNEVKTRHIHELETKYQTVQKEIALSEKQLQITQKDMQLQKSRQFIYYTLSGLALALMAAGLLYMQVQNRKKAFARRIESMQQEKEIQLLQALMQGEEKERSRIANDLHDGVAGMLAAVKMHLGTLPEMNSNVLTAEGYKHGMVLLDEASREVRKISHNLMPEVLLQHGLDEAMRRYCNSVSNSSRLLVQYDSLGEALRFRDSFELSVYRIVQELLNNIIKHSKASQAIVQASFQHHLLSITIEDNGIGFSKEKFQSDGMGLHSLLSRVRAINGKMQMDSDEGQGVSAYLEFETSGLEQKVAVATPELHS